MRIIEKVASDECANSESDLEVEDFDSEGESSEEELEEFDENGNLVVVRDEVDLYHSRIIHLTRTYLLLLIRIAGVTFLFQSCAHVQIS